MGKKLYILTSHFPFVPGEQYLEAEIKHLSLFFETIYIISNEKYTARPIRIIPGNVKLVILNKKFHSIKTMICGLMKLFSNNTIKEIIFSVSKMKQKFTFFMLKQILLYEIVSARLEIWAKENISKSENNVIYSYWLSTTAYALVKLKKKGYMFKAISRAHGYDAFLDRGYLPFRREVYTHLDQIHFISKTAKLNFENQMAPFVKTHAKLYLSYLGVNCQNDINPSTLLHDLPYVFVSCSNIYHLKRLDMIIDTLSLIKDIRIHWIHFGDGSIKQELDRKASNQFLNTLVTYEFKGYVDNQKVIDFYRNNHVDLFLNTSDYEGIPVSMMEALSFGIPIFGRDVGGISEIIVHELNGYLLPKNATPIDMSNTIKQFCNISEVDRNTMRRNAITIQQKCFNSDSNYIEFSSVISN